MMCCVPSLTLPVIPGGRVAGSTQPVLPAGGGLILRPWRPADARAVATAYADPAIQRWHARRVDSEDEARDLILRWQRSWASETGVHWAVTSGGGGEVLGRMSLRWRALDEGRAECAYSQRRPALRRMNRDSRRERQGTAMRKPAGRSLAACGLPLCASRQQS